MISYPIPSPIPQGLSGTRLGWRQEDEAPPTFAPRLVSKQFPSGSRRAQRRMALSPQRLPVLTQQSLSRAVTMVTKSTTQSKVFNEMNPRSAHQLVFSFPHSYTTQLSHERLSSAQIKHIVRAKAGGDQSSRSSSRLSSPARSR